MWLQSITGLMSIVGSFFAFAVFAITYLYNKPSWKKIIELHVLDSYSTLKLPIINQKTNCNSNAYILRKKDYETYQSIKYKAGIKSAAMSGSNLILIDLDLIKTINQRDFQVFPDRHPPSYHPDPTMSQMLSFATGEEWKRLKCILTQAFSTTRIRRVKEGLHESSMKLVRFIRSELSAQENKSEEAGDSALEIVRPMNKYLLELIARSVFGLDDTGVIWESDNSPFEMYTKEVQKAMIRHRQARAVPGLLRLAKMFNLICVDKTALEFFKSVISKSIEKKNNKGEQDRRDDLLHLFMEASSKNMNEDEKKAGSNKLTQEMILSQAFMFFFAGTEGPATLLIYGLYELAMNQDVQQRLYEEILGVMKDDTEACRMDFELISNLPYLDMFVCEVLRMYSSSVTARRCSKKYKVPGTDLVIEPGTPVHTPIYGIHHDEEFYPNPFKFNPDNFTEEAKARRPTGAYQPFGLGPRSCIAQKFGLIQGKEAICSLVCNFKVTRSWRTESPPNGTIESMFLPENGLWLMFEDRMKDTKRNN